MFSLSKFPVLKLLYPYIIGVVLGNYNLNLNFFTLIFCSIFLLFVTVILYIKKIRSWQTAFTFFVFLMLGFIYASEKLKTHSKITVNAYTTIALSGKIIDINDGPKNTKITISNYSINNGKRNFRNCNIYIKNVINNNFAIGDFIYTPCKLIDASIIQNPINLDLRNYYKYHNTDYLIFIYNEKYKIIPSTSFNLKKWSKAINLNLRNTLKLFQNQKDFALTSAMILGNDNFIEKSTLQTFNKTGLLHILSVSGMHVAMIYMSILWIIGIINLKYKNNIYVSLISLLIIWFYVLMVGLEIAAIRSAFMISVMIFTKILKRNVSSINGLFISAFFILIHNPLTLFDIGFQLSYASLAGILIIQPMILNLYLPRTKIGLYTWQLVCISISAQVFTAPILLYYTNTFANYFIVSNLLCMGLSEVIIYGGILLLLFSPMPIIAHYIAECLHYIISIFCKLIYLIAMLPNAVSSVFSLNLYTTLLILICILFVTTLLYTKQKIYFVLSLATIFTIICKINYDYFIKTNVNKIFVFKYNNNLEIIDKQKRQLIYYTSKISEEGLRKIKEFAKKNYCKKIIIKRNNYKAFKNIAININGKKINFNKKMFNTINNQNNKSNANFVINNTIDKKENYYTLLY